MKKINFVKAGILDQKRAAKQAPKTVALITFVSIAIVLVLQIQQWKVLQKVTKEKAFHTKRMALFNAVLEKKRTLKDQQKLLKKRVDKINGIQNNMPPSFTLFAAIDKALGETGTLESLTTAHNKVDMVINCQTIKKATRFMQRIAELPSIASLDLVAIHPQGQRFLFTITGKRV